MKKLLLLLAAIGVAGLVSAMENKDIALELERNTENSISNSQNIISLLRIYQWAPITTSCGSTFYLDYNMYSSYEAFQNDARHFTDIKCGADSAYDSPF